MITCCRKGFVSC